MLRSTDDLRVLDLKELSSPRQVISELPITPRGAATAEKAREAVRNIVHGSDARLVVVVGPCSVHDVAAAQDYAARLAQIRRAFAANLEIVMRVYFEKPRTTVGWKGLINDPDLDGSFDINKGLRLARRLLVEINDLGVPVGTEYLDMTTPQYISDLISWGAIGARTTESQVHRELASGLSCPVGFKNGTEGNIKIAFEAVRAASHPHHFLGVTKDGHSAIISTAGNEDCHVILRGGLHPNYDRESIEAACVEAGKCGIACRLMVDASHGNSGKDPANQAVVIASVCQQISGGEESIFGVMLESNLVGGRQELRPPEPLAYGQSITDACLGWEDTVPVLETLAGAVEDRRRSRAA